MSRSVGLWGEEQVAAYLRARGYTLLAHGYHCRYGEIDLVAKTGETICFVEVKLRSSVRYGLPREAVTAQKQEKLRKTALSYLSQYALDCPARFDVAEVYTDTAYRTCHIEYLENAF